MLCKHCHIAMCNECCLSCCRGVLLQCNFYSFIVKGKFDGARQSQHGSSHCLSWICKGSFDKRHKCIEEVLTSAEAELVRVQLVKRLKQLLNKGCLNVCLHVVLRVVISKPSPSSVARYLCFVTCLYKSVRAVAYCYIAVVFQCLSVQNVAVKLRLALCFMMSCCFVELLCQVAMSSCYVELLCQVALSSCFVKLLCRVALWSCYVELLCQVALSSCFVMLLCRVALSSCYVELLCRVAMSSCYYNIISKLSISVSWGSLELFGLPNSLQI